MLKNPSNTSYKIGTIMEEITITDCVGFEWDTGNEDKNRRKHQISKWQCEQVFFNSPLLVYEDIKHTDHERRSYLLGHTDLDRRLFISFTIRNKLIRVISARPQSRKERVIYEKACTYSHI
jgi:uncharacterized DUF497 family protein